MVRGHHRAMQTIVIASQKGGAGKSTLALHLATLAQAEGPTLLIDTDPQGSLAFWHERREAKTPLLVKIGTGRLPEVLEAARNEGVRWVLIDTPPHDSAGIAAAMRLADLVLIPARPSALDLHAVESTLRMIEAVQQPALVILSQAPSRRGFGEPTAVREARQVIEAMGGKVADNFIAARAVAAQSVVAGLSVGEMEPQGAAAKEFSAIWAEAKAALPGLK